ncbi:MAG: beta-ketoacyl synthase N-terminal-like domain-containing protein [Polyangiaceae bacterium]
MSAVVLHAGISAPMGLTAAAAQRAIVAGVAAFSETLVHDQSGDPVRASHLPSLPPDLDRTERITFFATRALADCLSPVEKGHAPPIHAFVALPPSDPARPVNAPYVLSQLKKETDHLPMEWAASPVLAGGAGFFHALSAACTAVLSGRAPLALAGAADSACDAASLGVWVHERRALNQHNRDGSLPGEGAGFVLIGRGPSMGLSPIGKLVACAVAPGKGTLGELFQALHAANASRPRPDHLFACQTANRATGRALMEAYFRAPKLMPEPFRMTLSAESQGDAGVAAGAVELCATLHRFSIARRRMHPLRTALLAAPGEGGKAAGALVAAP